MQPIENRRAAGVFVLYGLVVMLRLSIALLVVLVMAFAMPFSYTCLAIDGREAVLMRTLEQHAVWCLEAMAAIGSMEEVDK